MYLSRRLVLTAPLVVAAVPLTGAAAYGESCGREQLSAQLVATDSAVRSDQRPMAAGVYDPAASKTFAAWIGTGSHPLVAAYDHRSGTWSAPKRVGTSPFLDAHNYPAIIQANDGRLLVFHGAHNSTQRLTISQPHTIDGEWADADLPLAAYSSYPMPVKASNGDIYLFYRETSQFVEPGIKFTDDRPELYLISRDHGQTWQQGTPHSRWAIWSTARTDNMNEIYIGQIRQTPRHGRIPERFHFVWTLAGGGPGIHEHDRYHRNLYYAAFQPGNGHFYAADGRDLGTWIDGEAMEAYTKVLHTELVRAKPLTRDLGYTALVGIQQGKPILLYNTQDGDIKVINAARWTGHEWDCQEVARDLGILEMEQLSPTLMRIYMVPRDEPVGVQTYLLRAGRHWESEQRIPTSGPISRASLIPGHREPVRLLITGSSSSNQTIAGGDVSAIGHQ